MKLRLLFVVLCFFIGTTNTFSQGQIGQDIDGEAAGDLSGKSVSLSSDGNTVAIGASYNDGNGTNSGHVRIYENTSDSAYANLIKDVSKNSTFEDSTTNWASQGNHTATVESNQLKVVATSGGTGSSNATTLSADTYIETLTNGKTYKYTFSCKALSGTPTLKIRPPFEMSPTTTDIVLTNIMTEHTIIGERLAMDNAFFALAVAGTFYIDNISITEVNTGSWSQIGQDIDGEAAYDQSGYSVSLSSDGNTVAIGAHGNDGNGSYAGHVRVYENIGGSWSQLGQDLDGEASNDFSGYSISLSSNGGTVAIGARNNDGNGTDAGHVRIYENINGTWSQVGQDIDGESAEILVVFLYPYVVMEVKLLLELKLMMELVIMLGMFVFTKTLILHGYS